MKEQNTGQSISGRLDSNPGARLLEAARELFNEQGYQIAGINEIISRSGTSKKSFYNYFPSKRKLGEAYLMQEREELIHFMDRLTARHCEDYRAFVRAWTFALKTSAGSEDYFGCPFSKTRAQAADDFTMLLAETIQTWRDKLKLFLMNSDLKLSGKNADKLAEMMLIQYQGAIQMWRLSGESRYFDLFEEALHSLAGVTLKRGRRESSGP